MLAQRGHSQLFLAEQDPRHAGFGSDPAMDLTQRHCSALAGGIRRHLIEQQTRLARMGILSINGRDLFDQGSQDRGVERDLRFFFELATASEQDRKHASVVRSAESHPPKHGREGWRFVFEQSEGFRRGLSEDQELSAPQRRQKDVGQAAATFATLPDPAPGGEIFHPQNDRQSLDSGRQKLAGLPIAGAAQLTALFEQVEAALLPLAVIRHTGDEPASAQTENPRRHRDLAMFEEKGIHQQAGGQSPDQGRLTAAGRTNQNERSGTATAQGLQQALLDRWQAGTAKRPGVPGGGRSRQ